MHLQQGRFVVGDVRVHRANDAALIDDLANVRQRFADLDPALPVWPELERRRHEAGRVWLLVNLAGRLGVFVFLQRRLGVERVDMRRAAVHEQEDHPLGPGREVRSTGAGGTGLFPAKHPGQAKRAEAGRATPKHLSPIDLS